MVQKLFYFLVALMLFMITGCSNGEELTKVSIDSINAEDVLRLDPDADIFQYEGVIYKTNIDWVEDLSLTKNVQISEIMIKNETNSDFIDDMANKLPVGTKIFSAKERGDIFIVELEGSTLKYLAIVEG